MKRLVRLVSIFMVVVMLLTTPAFAAESVQPRSSSFFSCSSVYLYKLSGASFEVWFDVTGTGIMEEIGARTIKVQRSSDGETWTTMKTFRMGSYPQMICENTAQHSDYVTYTGAPGYYYRAYIVLYAKDSSGTGEMYRYTSTLKV